jgi:hypothetical protein
VDRVGMASQNLQDSAGRSPSLGLAPSSAEGQAHPPLPLRRSSPLLKTLTALSGTGLLLAGGFLAGLGYASQPWIARVVTLLTNRQPLPQVDTRTLVVQQVRGASELTTAVFTMEAVVPTTRDRTLGGYTVGTTTLLYIGYGEVRAGVDLSQLRPEHVTLQGDRITVQLPPPSILDTKLDVTRSTVYDYDRGFLSLGPDAAPELQQLAQQTTLARITQAACQQDLLADANARAKQMIEQLLLTAGYSQVTVQSQPVDASTCLASVQSF